MSKNNVTLCGAVAVLLYIGGGPGCGYARTNPIAPRQSATTRTHFCHGGTEVVGSRAPWLSQPMLQMARRLLFGMSKKNVAQPGPDDVRGRRG